MIWWTVFFAATVVLQVLMLAAGVGMALMQHDSQQAMPPM